MQVLMITAVLFLAVLLTVFVIYSASVAMKESKRSEVKRRLRSLVVERQQEKAPSSMVKEEVLSEIPALNRFLLGLPPARRVQKLIDYADSDVKAGALMLTTAVLAGAGLLIGVKTGRGIIIGAVLAALFSSSPYIYLLQKGHARLRKFTEQFPDALDMIARSLRAGHSFASALQIVHQEMPEPAGKLFRVVYDEQNLGLSLTEALGNMTRRIDSLDLKFFVTAVNIQRQTGGNLAEILEKLGVTIRERLKIVRQIRVYTAQGRLSGYILAAVPIMLALALMVINPGYLMLLFQTEVGMYMVAGALALQVIGFFVIKKIINIQI